MKGYAAAIAVPVLLLLVTPAGAFTLVTAEEAAMPPGAPQPLRGP